MSKLSLREKLLWKKKNNVLNEFKAELPEKDKKKLKFEKEINILLEILTKDEDKKNKNQEIITKKIPKGDWSFSKTLGYYNASEEVLLKFLNEEELSFINNNNIFDKDTRENKLFELIMLQNEYFISEGFEQDKVLIEVLDAIVRNKLNEKLKFFCQQIILGKTSTKEEIDYIIHELKVENGIIKKSKIKESPNKKLKIRNREKIVKIKTRKEEVLDINKIEEKTNLKVFDKNKEPLNIIFIGHVDTGKSTICGSILYYSGAIKETEIAKLKMEAKEGAGESWFFSFIMDINEEERKRGKTVEVGKVDFETENKRFTILDCPGHHNFVPNMISGAAQADVGCLIVSARPGEFEAGFEENGQTKEHAMLAKSLGCNFLVVIVNKMDTVDWIKERYDYIKESLNPFLQKSCGYDINKDIVYIPISGLKGQNINDHVKADICNWYKGNHLFQQLNSIPSVERPKETIVRFPVLDKLTHEGNLILSGKVESGNITKNMDLVLVPYKADLKVKKVLDTTDNEVAYAGPGENIKIVVTGIDETYIKRGSIICGVEFQSFIVKEFLAEIRILDLGSTILTKGFSAIMHMHTLMEPITIKKILYIIDENGKKIKKKLNQLKSGFRGYIKIETDVPIAVEKYSHFPQLGRFTLRDGSNTIGIGTIDKVKPLEDDFVKNCYFMNQDNNDTKEQVDITDLDVMNFNGEENTHFMEDGEDI